MPMEEFIYLLQKIRNDRINLREDMEAIMHLQKDMMHRICRLCLTGMAEKLQPSARIYKNKTKYSDLADKLLNIKINSPRSTNRSPELNFHSNICDECSASLVLFNHFREKCEQSNVVLNKLKKLVSYYDDDDQNPPFPASKLLRLEIDTGVDGPNGDDNVDVQNRHPIPDLDMECIIGDSYGDQQVLFADTSIFPHAIKRELVDSDDEMMFDEAKPKRKARARRYACKLCEYKFETPSKLKKHLQSHIRKDKFAAEKRGDVFIEEESDAFELINNLSLGLTNPLESTSKNDLSAAMSDTSATKRVSIGGGGGGGGGGGSGRSRERKYTCPVCQHMTESPSKLKRHMAKHNRELKQPDQEAFICEQCEVEMPSEDYMRVHKLDHEALAIRSRNRSGKQDHDKSQDADEST